MPAIYDRRVSPVFLSHFDEADPSGGALSSLVDYAMRARYPVDLQFRRDPKKGRDHATLYVGLTAVLNLRSTKKGLLSLDVHPTHQKAGAFDKSWSDPVAADVLYERWPDVELYLDRIIPLATASHGSKEGAVQAAVSSYASSSRVVIDREVTPSFAHRAEKVAFLKACRQPILEALAGADLGFGGVPKKLGNECDAIAVDHLGRLLAIEVKPHGVGSVAFVAAQALMYARILRSWVASSPSPSEHEPLAVLQGMVAQRQQVGLIDHALEVADPVRIVPVVALQRGSSPEMVRRMLAVRGALSGVDPTLDPIEIYEVSLLGDLVPLDESRRADGRPRPRNYAAAANRQMIAWKHDPISSLPDEARRPGQVRTRQGVEVDIDYALPIASAAHNLLPEVRQPVLDLFWKHRIAWHQGTTAGPTAHLRSSQVQCLNALGQMMSQSERIRRAFGTALDVAEVRDFGSIDPAEAGRFLTFEFTGSSDYFGEARGGTLTRGAQTTSVDAAFAYTDADGRSALALVEWKFTEATRGADPRAAAKEPERLRRYETALRDAEGPLRIEGIDDLGVLFHEPIYQLVRQQLLARALQRDPAVDAEVVRVVHVLSPDNTAYQRSFVHPALRRRGDTVMDVWGTLLRDPATFVEVDPSVFLDPDVTSDEYVRRYAIAT